jgi:hypothetical protein
MERVGLFYGHLIYIIAIWYIFGSSGIFYGLFGIFFPFRYAVSRKSGNPASVLSSLSPFCTGLNFAPFYSPS